jgi:hypothetical protein
MYLLCMVELFEVLNIAVDGLSGFILEVHKQDYCLNQMELKIP